MLTCINTPTITTSPPQTQEAADIPLSTAERLIRIECNGKLPLPDYIRRTRSE